MARCCRLGLPRSKVSWWPRRLTPTSRMPLQHVDAIELGDQLLQPRGLRSPEGGAWSSNLNTGSRTTMHVNQLGYVTQADA